MLQRWARRRRSAAGLAQRSRIVLACAEGQTNVAVAEHVGVSVPTVRRWRGRFAERRLDGLLDEPRPGRPREISDEQVEAVIVKTLETKPPDNGTHWSTRNMAAAAGLNQTAISRIWRAFGLQPHRVEHFKLSQDPQFVEKIRDVVGLYLDPPERAIVLCVDEKSQIQALDRSQPILPLMPGVPERQSSRGRERPCGHRESFLRGRGWRRKILTTFLPATTTSATARRACSPRWTSPPARSSARCTPATARSSSRSSYRRSTARYPPNSTCT